MCFLCTKYLSPSLSNLKTKTICTLQYKVRGSLEVMANALERAVYSVFSSIFHCCSYQGDHRHDTRSTAHYYSSSNPSSSNTFYFVEGKNGYNRRMAKGRPLSLQVNLFNLFMLLNVHKYIIQGT